MGATQAHDREREGLEMVLAGLRQGLNWMPQGAPSGVCHESSAKTLGVALDMRLVCV
jgi:hypothetical protein